MPSRHISLYESARVAWNRCRNADVDDHDGGADVASKHVDRGPARAEVGDHLGGHFGGPRGNACAHHTMVTREDSDRHGFGNGRGADARDGGQLHTNGFEKPERTLRLREAVLKFARFASGRCISRCNATREFAEMLLGHVSPF